MARDKDLSSDAFRLLKSARTKSSGSSYPVSTDQPLSRGARRALEGGRFSHTPTEASSSTKPSKAGIGKPEPVADDSETQSSRLSALSELHPGIWLLQLIALGTAFGLGRLSVPGAVEAAPGQVQQDKSRSLGDIDLQVSRGSIAALPEEQESTPSEESAASSKPAPAPQLSAPDQAFLDLAHAYTILTVTYDYPQNKRPEVTEGNRALAIENFTHLTERGLPVVTPRFKGEHLMIFVGASAKQESLNDLLQRVRATPGPNGRGLPYESAMITNIQPYRWE